MIRDEGDAISHRVGEPASGARVIGIDLGERRIGVAVSDGTGTLASPHGVIERSRDRAADHGAIAALVAELDAERVVVGLPLSLSGAAGPAARAALAEAAALASVLAVPVETFDERLTTVAAAQSLRAGGVKARKQRKRIDEMAASVMLQNWLEQRRA
ncbi:MAG: putative pre6S rRNA nuclease [Actinomycetota bacterium]|nr:putative pre6S rRNA nuclease [Actinomycetota bacterium]